MFGLDVDLKDPARRADDASRLFQTYALRSTEYVIDEMARWLESQGKKFMVLLSYGSAKVKPIIGHGEPRFDQSLVEYLDRSDIPYVDGLEKIIRNRKAGEVIWHQRAERAPKLVNAAKTPFRSLIIALK